MKEDSYRTAISKYAKRVNRLTLKLQEINFAMDLKNAVLGQFRCLVQDLIDSGRLTKEEASTYLKRKDVIKAELLAKRNSNN